MSQPSEKNLIKMWNYAEKYVEKSGTYFHPDHHVTEGVILGLAHHLDTLGRPLCPCNFYPDKKEEIKNRRWFCACNEMKKWKYCHCLLFVNEAGLPITEYLSENHEGRQIYGLVKDPYPDKGQEYKDRALDENLNLIE